MKKYTDTQNLLERIDQLIRLKATGTAKEFATKLGVSRETLFRKFKHLREIGKPVKYCKYRRTFYYDERGIKQNIQSSTLYFARFFN